MAYLFATDENKNEVIVSVSVKGSLKIKLVEMIKYQNNIHLYNAVKLLNAISKDDNFNPNIFKSMDKVCQLLYSQHKEKL